MYARILAKILTWKNKLYFFGESISVFVRVCRSYMLKNIFNKMNTYDNIIIEKTLNFIVRMYVWITFEFSWSVNSQCGYML